MFMEEHLNCDTAIRARTLYLIVWQVTINGRVKAIAQTMEKCTKKTTTKKRKLSLIEEKLSEETESDNMCCMPFAIIYQPNALIRIIN